MEKKKENAWLADCIYKMSNSLFFVFVTQSSSPRWYYIADSAETKMWTPLLHHQYSLSIPNQSQSKGQVEVCEIRRVSIPWLHPGSGLALAASGWKYFSRLPSSFIQWSFTVAIFVISQPWTWTLQTPDQPHKHSKWWGMWQVSVSDL